MSLANFLPTVRGARSAYPVGFIGQPAVNDNYRSKNGNNSSPQANDTWTISVPAAPDDSTDYAITHNGLTATYAADSSSTQAEVGAGLAAAYNASPGMRAKYAATYAAGTITLTAVGPGYTYTPTVNSADTAQDLGSPDNTVVAASADTVAFGLVLASVAFASEGSIRRVFVPTTSLMTAQVLSFTFAGNTASYYHGTVEVNGREYNWGGVVWDTNLDTTCTAIAAAINAVMPTETVIAASVGGGGGVVTLTAEVEGAEFEADAHAQGHADAEATKVYTTGPSTATSLARAFVGISERRLDVEDLTIGGDDPAYPANGNLVYQIKGEMWVQRDTSETWAPGDACYVSVASATKGRVYNAAGTDRVYLPPQLLRVERSEPSSTSDGLGLVSIYGG